MLTFRAIGDWSEAEVSARWATDTRRRIPEVESQIERAWTSASARLGSGLFDGPMCRLEQLDATTCSLRLWVSPTSYKPFLGTNLMNPDVPPAAMANPVGLSAALVTSDGWLMLGRRNASVAYYPNRVHPFAGSLEPREAPNVFDGIRRELAEELRFTPGDVSELRCLGLIEDARLRQPEIVFSVRSMRTRAHVEAMLDTGEHHASVAVEGTPCGVEAFMRDSLLTPVAVGTLALWGRIAFGDAWFVARRGEFETS
ncbi:MAG: hypothetical protein WBD40_19455 [Tepidisphaeraceae bacterium]